MKKSILFLSKFFGTFLCALAIALSLAYRFSSSNALSLCLGLLLVFIGWYYVKLPRRGQKWVNALLTVGTCFVVGMVTLISVNAARETATFTEDSVLVLGCGIKGEKVTSGLQYRLDRCLEYLEKNPNVVVVVSGGQGPGEAIPEALAMQRYLVEKGVNPNMVLMENKSTDTYENMVFSKVILDAYFSSSKPNGYTTVCITNGFHSYRSLGISQRVGFSMTNYNAGLKWYLVPGAYIREIASICKYWVYR